MSGDYPFKKIYDMYSRIMQNLQIRALNLQDKYFCITSMMFMFKIYQDNLYRLF